MNINFKLKKNYELKDGEIITAKVVNAVVTAQDVKTSDRMLINGTTYSVGQMVKRYALTLYLRISEIYYDLKLTLRFFDGMVVNEEGVQEIPAINALCFERIGFILANAGLVTVSDDGGIKLPEFNGKPENIGEWILNQVKDSKLDFEIKFTTTKNVVKDADGNVVTEEKIYKNIVPVTPDVIK